MENFESQKVVKTIDFQSLGRSDGKNQDYSLERPPLINPRSGKIFLPFSKKLKEKVMAKKTHPLIDPKKISKGGLLSE